MKIRHVIKTFPTGVKNVIHLTEPTREYYKRPIKKYPTLISSLIHKFRVCIRSRNRSAKYGALARERLVTGELRPPLPVRPRRLARRGPGVGELGTVSTVNSENYESNE
ncbi:hypothetical protein EVAR_45457_1 [Eumeta japonica]|uniref:Uncharacterized protein n=1 Tax=Eumeta variegata TaxID=151549 RepID=A0A4C1YLI2_EUMVA|nr:hypothetical protein EVAR_45457_1 [Eumeta japonica]